MRSWRKTTFIILIWGSALSLTLCLSFMFLGYHLQANYVYVIGLVFGILTAILLAPIVMGGVIVESEEEGHYNEIINDRKDLLKKAKHLEKEDRLHESAEIYESLWKHDKAGELRKQADKDPRKSPSHDPNNIFRMIRKEGYVVPYKCSHCSNKFKITGKERAHTCPHCQADIDMRKLQRLLRDAVC